MALSLAIEGLDAGYGAVKALRGVTLHVEAGETVALLGTNGNGKSTLMKCIMGLVRPDHGRLSLTLDGKAHDLTKLSAEEIVDLGVALVPEGRRLFPKLTVTENLMLGAFRKSARGAIRQNLLVHLTKQFPQTEIAPLVGGVQFGEHDSNPQQTGDVTQIMIAGGDVRELQIALNMRAVLIEHLKLFLQRKFIQLRRTEEQCKRRK